jgi:hypothetical protein
MITIPGTRYEPGTSRIRNRSATHFAATFGKENTKYIQNFDRKKLKSNFGCFGISLCGKIMKSELLKII